MTSLLIGRAVTFTLARENRVGTYSAVVRDASIHTPPRRNDYLKVQRASTPDACTLSARYRGEILRLTDDELVTVTVHYRGSTLPIDAFLRRAATLHNKAGAP